MPYRLLDKFRGLFNGVRYRHRDSSLGDSITSYFYDDLAELGRSAKLRQALEHHTSVVNTKNVMVGKSARRGDGTFGERVPNTPAVSAQGHHVAFGKVATVDIGIEVKILAKAMIKQVDRVGTDMLNQAMEFRRHGGNPICVGIVGINRAAAYTSYEGVRSWPTDGRKHKHPIQEAEEAELRLIARVRGSFDEFIVLRFEATNVPPHPFSWVDLADTEDHYAASLLRVSREYDLRF
jgi:hypothetical protein